MVCALCQAIENLTPGRLPDGVPRDAAPDGTCERCGRALTGDTLEHLTAKVAQLERFGLTGRPPLFRRRI